MTEQTETKRYVCPEDDCGRSFTRSDHLRRHMLNHSTGNSTCPRCRLHFKRPDLLHRHMIRHQQKDEDAGGPGLGVVESRKRMWLDADGNVVTKRPFATSSGNAGRKENTTKHLPLQCTPSQAGSREGQRPRYEPLSNCVPSIECFERFSQQYPQIACDHVYMDLASEAHDFSPSASPDWLYQPLSCPNEHLNSDAVPRHDTTNFRPMDSRELYSYNWLCNVGLQIGTWTPQNDQMTTSFGNGHLRQWTS